MDPRPHPADAIEQLRRARGDEPSQDRYDRSMPNDRIPDDTAPVQAGAGLQPTGEVVPPRTGPGPIGSGGRAERQSVTTPPLPAAEGVSLTHGEGYYQGYLLKLKEGELQTLRAFLGKVVLRHLEEERARVQRTFKGDKP